MLAHTFTFIFLAVSQFLQTIMSYSHCSLHTKNCSRFFKWKTSGWPWCFLLYLFLFFLYLFNTSGWSWWWKRPRLSSRSILTFFFSWSKNVLYFNILHINWPEDSIKLIQSNLELWTEFHIVSNYSTLILRKIKRMKKKTIFFSGKSEIPIQ